MGFLTPKVPKPPPPPNPAVRAQRPDGADLLDRSFASPESLISTSARGLKRKASTQRGSLIGGG